MWKALIKKQLMEVNVWLLQDRKNGKRRSGFGMAGLIFFYVTIFGFLGATFFIMGSSLCAPLVSMELGWLYFAIMGLVSLAMGIFGSVFNTYATLYRAKDNEFLLSMPISPSAILVVRLFGVWMWSMIYEAIVFIPALIAYWMAAGVSHSLSIAVIVFDLLIFFLLSVFVLNLSCILGWAVAKLSTKVRNKSFVIVFLSLAFMVLYYWGYSQVYTALQNILANAEKVGAGVRGAVYPMYLMGRACEGNFVSLLLFALMVLALFAATYYVMERTFIKMATANQGAVRREYKETAGKARGKEGALLYKEWKRFTTSPVYMLNCGLGALLMPVFGIFLLIKADMVRSLVFQLFDETFGVVPLLACWAVCSVASVNDITAPSISLEGKNLWLLQSIPVTPWQVLKAKLKLHLLLTGIPAAFCVICFAIVLRLSPFGAVLVFLVSFAYIFLSAAFGLMINLKAPNLKWTNEMVPIKQSFGVLAAMMGGMVFVLLLAVLYFVLRRAVLPEIYLIFCGVLCAALSALLLFWLKRRGTGILEFLDAA